MQVYNFGSVNIDLVYRVPHLVKPGETLSSQSLQTVLGGKGANQSVALARAGASVQHIGKLGEADSWARDSMAQAGVDVSSVEMIAGPSGHAIIQVDNAGENSIILHGGANQSFSRDELDVVLSSASAGDWLLIQNECNALESAFELAETYQLRIALNPAPMTDAVMQLPLSRCELLIVNETEAAALAGTDDLSLALTILSERFPSARLVLTLGSKGAMLRYGSIQRDVPAMKVTAVDTTGAGDTFVGYYLAALVSNCDEETALQRACAAAALSVTKQGATPSIPTVSEVDLFLQRAGHG